MKDKKFKTLITKTGRVCTKCSMFKLWEEFPSANSKKITTKKASSCRQCKKEKRKAIGRTKERYQRKKRIAEVKLLDPFLARARSLRSSLLSRFKSVQQKAITPSVQQLYQWLKDTPLVCYYSGENLLLTTLHIDHKQPVARGGTNELSNLCFASHHMNTAKGGMTEYEFKKLLILISTWEDKGKKLLSRLKQGHF